MSVINTNVGALMARTYATETNNKMQTSMERLSSGLRVNSAADDAAGLAVGHKMTASIKSYEMGVRNSADMISLLSTAENSLSQILKMQLRIRELAVQSANGVYTDRDRDNIEIESAGLIREMDRLAAHTKFRFEKSSQKIILKHSSQPPEIQSIQPETLPYHKQRVPRHFKQTVPARAKIHIGFSKNALNCLLLRHVSKKEHKIATKIV